jgi:hypothetical protein
VHLCACIPDSDFIPAADGKEGDADSGLILAWNFQLASLSLSDSFSNLESGLIPASDGKGPSGHSKQDLGRTKMYRPHL